MSEKIYAWLLRLYPSRFRAVYGEAALQLYRDRSRDERAGWSRVRLWFDLAADLAISLPREYRNAHAALTALPVRPMRSGVPSFCILEGGGPRRDALWLGGGMALLGLCVFWSMLSHGGTHVAIGASASGSASGYSGAGRGYDAQPDGRDSTAPLNRSGEPTEVMDAEAKHRVIEGAIANLKEYYVYPDTAEKMSDALAQHEKRGDDNWAMSGDEFAGLLTNQMREVSHDRHLGVDYSREKVADRLDGPTPEDLARYRRDMEQRNCMIEKVQILSGNIGYVKFDAFPAKDVCGARMAAAMKSVNRASAVIFDLRDNRGGDPRTVALIATYLFDHSTHLNDIYNRGENHLEESWTGTRIPGNHLTNKPAFVLMSHATFSGGEEFCYDLKNLKRATLVGETTGGGAHLTRPRRIDDHFEMRMPEARAVNPITKTNWEGTGVEPDVKVSAKDALKTAEMLAAAKIKTNKH